MFLFVGNNVALKQLGGLAHVRPSKLAHGKAEILGLHLVPNQEALARRQTEVITAPNNLNRRGGFASLNLRGVGWRVIPCHFFVFLAHRISGNPNPIRRVSYHRVNLWQGRQDFQAVA